MLHQPPAISVVAATPALNELAVVSWNTNVGGGDVPGLVADLRDGRLTDGDSVRHFVLLLQEAYRASEEVPRGEALRPRRIATQPRHGERLDIVAVARELGLYLLYVPSMANGWSVSGAAEDRGNAILSTLPLSGHTAIELPFEGQRRVAASATVNVTDTNGRDRALRVVSVHLDNRSGMRRVMRSFGSGRARQAEALAAALVHDSTAQLPTVLAGDLNTWAPPAWERAVSLLRAHFPLGETMRVPTLAKPPMVVGRTLDHMMFRLPIARAERLSGPSGDAADDQLVFAAPQLTRLDDPRGSDHYPLLARLTLHDGR